MKIIAIIPARGGSKGVPGKNIKNLNGRSLISYSIGFAERCDIFDRIIVSTDEVKIASEATRLNAEVINRPNELALDDSLVIDTIKYVLKKLKEENYSPDIVFLLEPTSPLRNVEDVFKAIKAIDEGYDSAASYCTVDPPPSRIWRIEGDTIEPFISGSDPFLPRQKQSIGYKLTGQIYAFRPASIFFEDSNSIVTGKVFPIVTDSKKVIDIDTKIDFLIAEEMLKYYEEN